jgi:hypothetical protein
MATINVSGLINKVFASGVGFSVVEKQTNKKTGAEYKHFFNIFTKELDGHQVGDSVSVQGDATPSAFMGTNKDGQPEPKGSISVNQVTITKQLGLAAPLVDDDIF